MHAAVSQYNPRRGSSFRQPALVLWGLREFSGAAFLYARGRVAQPALSEDAVLGMIPRLREPNSFEGFPRNPKTGSSSRDSQVYFPMRCTVSFRETAFPVFCGATFMPQSLDGEPRIPRQCCADNLIRFVTRVFPFCPAPTPETHGAWGKCPFPHTIPPVESQEAKRRFPVH